jgi:hypothetical protein
MAKKNFKKRRAAGRAEQRSVPLWVWLAGGGAVAILLVAGLFYLGYQGENLAVNNIEGMALLPDPGRGHQNGDIEYSQVTPPGGLHNPEWLNCGIYDEPVRAENAIHSMEHGAVWLAYQPDLPNDQVETLQEIVRSERSRRGEALIILSPQPGLEAPIMATAWRVQLPLEEASDERLMAFLDSYQRGPFTPEVGATCTFGGVGEPVS